MDHALAAAANAVLEAADAPDALGPAVDALRMMAVDFAVTNARNMEVHLMNEADRKSAAEAMVTLLGGELDGKAELRCLPPPH